MYHSYVMGIDESIYTLETQGFEINRDGGNFMILCFQSLAKKSRKGC